MNINPVSVPACRQCYYNSCKMARLTNYFGFIDGTVRPISRPAKYQLVCYYGHKRVHGLKFQSVVLQNGGIGHLGEWTEKVLADIRV